MNTAWRVRMLLATLWHREAWTLPPSISRAMWRSMRDARPIRTRYGIDIHHLAPPVGSRAFGRYLNSLKRVSHGERVPVMAHISLTDRCDCGCERCSNIPSGRVEPTFEMVGRLLAELKDAGTACVAFTGGEPLLRDDLVDIVGLCGEEVCTTLFTTGIGLDAGRASQLAGAGLCRAFVSLDHFDRESHDNTRHRPGTFDDAVRAMGLFKKYGVHTAAQAVASEELLSEGVWERYVSFCGSIGVDEILLLDPMPVRTGSKTRELPEHTKMRLRDPGLGQSIKGAPVRISTMTRLEGPDYLGCQAGYTFIYINAGGDVYPCDFLPVSFGNVYAEGLGEVLDSLSANIEAPSRHCLASHMNGFPNVPRPVSLTDAVDIIKSCRGDGLPVLMEWIK
ncbi:MAG: radical SAM protein [Nitrospirae bacterium]|nr:radical SAM protein [Nitrospirota bacterium]MBI5696137.1 radical SAM protein [Nitrospirota bacterium]